jgi:ribonuclease HI
MATFYGVWFGKVTGVYESWSECQKQVNKFAGAKFKKLTATTKEQALIEFKYGK